MGESVRAEDFSSEEMEGGEAKLFPCLFGTRWRRRTLSPSFSFRPLPTNFLRGGNTRRATLLLLLRRRRSGANEKEKKARWCFLRISVALSQQKKEGGKGFFRFFVFLLSVSGRAWLSEDGDWIEGGRKKFFVPLVFANFYS